MFSKFFFVLCHSIKKKSTTEEEKQWLYQMMEDASCCSRPGTVLEECAMEVGVRVLDGELTPEAGAKEVERQMAIAMEE